jgi:hypothetical protein
MNNLAVFMAWSLIATLVLSSNSLDDLNRSDTIEGSISDNGPIVSEENFSNGVLYDSHSFNSSLTYAKPTTTSKKPPSLDFSLTGSKAVSPVSQITYTIKIKYWYISY